jgi:hypothetical protein
MMRSLYATIAVAVILGAPPARADDLPLEKIKLPPGFAIELVARVPNAREMALATGGTLFVGSMEAGKVYAVTLKPTGPATVTTIAAGLNRPVGVAFRDGALYVSAVSRILRFDNIESRLDKPPQPVVVSDKFPGSAHHGWKFIAFGPDGKLYVPVGAPCNICEPEPDRYAIITRMNPDGSGFEVYARGLRNSVGLGSAHQRTVVYEQRARLAGRGFTSRYIESCGNAGIEFRLSVLPLRHRCGSRIRQEALVQRIRGAGAKPRSACRPAGHALLHGRAVSARLSQSDLHR